MVVAGEIVVRWGWPIVYVGRADVRGSWPEPGPFVVQVVGGAGCAC